MWSMSITLITLLLGQLISASFLIPRQLSAPLDVPPACNNNCTELNTILQSCSSASCICTQLLLDDYASCFICLGGLTGASFDTPQQILNELVSECQQDGVTLTPVILPGEPSPAAAGPSPTLQNSAPLAASSSSASTSPASKTSSSPSSSTTGATGVTSATTTPSTTSTTTSSTPSLTPSSQQSSSSIQTPDVVLPTQTQPSNSTLPSTVPPPAVSETSGSGRVTVSIAAGVTAFGLFLGFLC